MSDLICRTFIERVDDFLEGRLSPADRRAAEEHLQGCGGCRDLIGLVADSGVPVAPPPDLIGAVLARTSGSACGSARARLCDHVDRLPAPVDDDLVRMHLDGCPECGALAVALARLAIDLPPLAEKDPGARFVREVLARTSRRETLPSRIAARLAAGWRALAHRPRIAWEGAYIGLIVMVILFGTPNAPFADVPARALGLVRTVQEAVPAPIGAVGGEARRMRASVNSAWKQTQTGMVDATGDLVTGMKRRSSATWEGFKKDLGTAWERIASQQTTHDANGTTKNDHGDGGEQ